MNTPPHSVPAPAWCLWRNPILQRFLRTRLRPRSLGAWLLVTVLIAGFIFFMSRSIGMREMERDLIYLKSDPAQIAQNAKQGYVVPAPSMVSVERFCLLPLLAFQGFILFIIGTGQVAGGMTADAEEGTMDYLRLSPMTPLAKVLGYLFGLPVREWILFVSTLPFTAVGIWRGQVPSENWLPVYAVVLTTGVLYHLTGLTAGTVLRNRRWAFLVSMGGVFLLYTVIPQLAKLGLVYFEYLTIMPVLKENMSGFTPVSAGALLKVMQSLQADVRFFGLGFPEAVFTILSQMVLCLTFVVMMWRRWQKSESHLLGKAWATGLSVWIQIVLLGCALPLIEPGLLFMSRRFGSFMSNRVRNFQMPTPRLEEAITMISLYGTVTLISVIVLAILIAPGREAQNLGTRRAARFSLQRIPFFSDEATSLVFVTIMSIAGGIGWNIFAQRVIGSHWFPGQQLPVWTPVAFGLVILTASLCSALIYELRGVKGLFLAAIFIGIVPILTGSVMGAANAQLSTLSIWVTTASPLAAPVNAVTTALPDGIGNSSSFSLAGPRAFIFWQGLMVIATCWLLLVHRAERKLRA